MSQHTEGPWKNYGRHIYEVGSDRPIGSAVVLAATNLKMQEEEEDVAVANARIMAASPDLLAALELMLDDVSWKADPDSTRSLRLARAAIAKAKGGA